MKPFERIVYTVTTDRELSDEEYDFLKGLGDVDRSVRAPRYYRMKDPSYYVAWLSKNGVREFQTAFDDVMAGIDLFIDHWYSDGENREIDFRDVYDWMVETSPVLEGEYQLCRDIFEEWAERQSGYGVRKRSKAKRQDCLYDVTYLLSFNGYGADHGDVHMVRWPMPRV